MHLLSVPGYLSVERGPVTNGRESIRGRVLHGVRAISFDFGNTLVPIERRDLARVVERMSLVAAGRYGPFDSASFVAAWQEERDRQFAEEVPRLREVDLGQRVVRVLARLRGLAPPPADRHWDDGLAQTLVDPLEADTLVQAYSAAFVELMPVPPHVGPLLERLAQRHVLGICSNWPLAATIDRYVEAAGWAGFLRAVIVSERVGTIKPDPRMFGAAEAALGAHGPDVLHVGDDWAADVVGATAVGWRTAHLRSRPLDSALPWSEPPRRSGRTPDLLRPDLELAQLVDLEGALA